MIQRYSAIFGLLIWGVVIVLVLVSVNHAIGETNANKLQYSGTLIDIPPCDINRVNLIEIDFGQIGVNKVSETGQEPLYQKHARFEVSCTGNRPDLFVRYLGHSTVFDNAAVKTSIADFGIQMRRADQGNNRIVIGEGWLISHDAVANDSVLSFIAVPVKKRGVELESGSFYATAGLQLEYP